ncbi:MAG: outer membrane beta-barrel protein [Cryomorphaceae bacterium]|nr:outer membrane beta-barrel protein [Cryomorphaceae bacterium]
MIRYFLIFAILLSGQMSFGQGSSSGDEFFNWGFRAGLHNTETRINPKNIPNVRSGEAKMGYHIGNYIRFNFGVFYIEPEVQFAGSQGELEFTNDGGEVAYESFSFNRIDVPIQIGQKLGPLRIYGGINLNFNRAEGLSSLVMDGLVSDSRAWRAGLGLDAGQFSMDVRYESSMGNNFEGVIRNGEPIDVNMRFTHIYLSLGFKFI